MLGFKVKCESSKYGRRKWKTYQSQWHRGLRRPVFHRLVVEIVGSNPTGGMHIYLSACLPFFVLSCADTEALRKTCRTSGNKEEKNGGG